MNVIYMKKTIFLIFLITFYSYSNFLLESPQILNELEIKELADKWDTEFIWNFCKFGSFSCCYENTRASFIIQLFKIPVFSYKYPYISSFKKWASKNKINRDYYYSKPLKFETSEPEIITIENLAAMMKDKNFVFYTGAGISAAKIPTMHLLMQSLKMNGGMKIFFKEAILNPEVITTVFTDFCKSCIENSPTQAHYALKEISQFKRIAILTENVDLLQQKTGINPIHTHSDKMHSLKSSDWNKVDILICIGLSHDDCGILRWYKESNPIGNIVAIDLGVPNYLSSKDFLLQGDLQIILPCLANLLFQQVTSLL